LHLRTFSMVWSSEGVEQKASEPEELDHKGTQRVDEAGCFGN